MIATPGSDKLMEEFKNIDPEEYKSPILTKSKTRKLIDTKLLSVGEKIEIIELHLGARLLTEILIKDNSTKESIQKFISELGYPSHFISSYRPVRNKTVEFLFIFKSESVKKFLLGNINNLTQFELAMLYGFPSTAVMAFVGIIKKKSAPYPTSRKAYQWYHSKVFSQDFYKDEIEYGRTIWNKVKKFCPEIIKLAEKEFKRKTS